MKNSKIICRLKKRHIIDEEKTLEHDDLHDQVLSRPSLLQKETIMLSFITIPPRECEHTKQEATTGPDETA